MAPPISLELRERIVSWRDMGLSISDIVLVSNRSQRAIYNILKNHDEYGQLSNPFTHTRTGRKRILERDDVQFIDGLVSLQPGLYLDEIRDKLLEVREVDISLATISCTLSRISFTKKSISKEALERNEHLRAVWQGVMGKFEPHQLVFIDESGVDDQTNVRRNGWAMMGQACVRRTSFLRGTKYSVLPALSINGILTLDIFEGSVNRERFIGFLDRNLVCL
jgi:transposase